MRLTFSNNPLDRFSCWFENEVLSPIAKYYYTHKKAHYKCCVCGYIMAPYFDEKHKWSLTYDMGWHKFKDWKCTRWICHHCADHGFELSSEAAKSVGWEGRRGYTWDEWNEIVTKDNDKLLDVIKNKDLEYYNYWFGDDDE